MTSRPVPPPSAQSAPFWTATRDHRLVQAFCVGCSSFLSYPRSRCPSCGSDIIEWRPLSGRGQVVAVTTVHRTSDPTWSERTPYEVSLVELDEGPRLLSSPPRETEQPACEVGARVEVAWEPLADGRAYPWFRPVDDGHAHRGPPAVG